jgi:hypothetical protein
MGLCCVQRTVDHCRGTYFNGADRVMTTLKVYVPDAADDTANGSITTAIKRRMADRFGGFTTIDAHGGWVNGNGKLIEEPVTIIQCEAPSDTDKRVLERFVEARCMFVKRMSNEDAVLGVVGDERIMVSD